MTVKKVRLLDEEETSAAATPAPVQAPASDLDTAALMKFLEAIDWKLWEMLKLARKYDEADK